MEMTTRTRLVTEEKAALGYKKIDLNYLIYGSDRLVPVELWENHPLVPVGPM